MTVTPSERSATSIRPREVAVASLRAPATVARSRPKDTATAAAAVAFQAWCSPTSRILTRARSPPAWSVKDGRPRSSRAGSSNRTSASSAVPKVRTRPLVRAAMARTSGSSALSTATPSSPSASTSSPLAWAIPAWEPNSPMCALPTFSTSAISGRATRQEASRSPTCRAPISRTRYSVAVSARSTVSGRPSSLLKEPKVATVRPAAASTWASRSLVLVLPCEPVSATTRTPGSLSRQWRGGGGGGPPRGPPPPPGGGGGRGGGGGPGPPPPGAGGGAGRAAPPPAADGGAGEVVAAPPAAGDRHEQTAVLGDPAVHEGRPGHGAPGVVHDRAAYHRGQLGQRHRDHREASSSRRTSRSSKGCRVPA